MYIYALTDTILQFHDQRITWQYIEDLYYHTKSSGGLSTMHKLKHEHVYLTSFSKMRVDLAAQVSLFVIILFWSLTQTVFSF